MKKSLHFLLLCFCSFFISNVFAQKYQQPDSLGLPGDNLNLYAVMELFQTSETLEGFERKLNSETEKINNLDLNNDDKIDYIRVMDHVDGNIHNIVLQVSINEKENQDIAFFIVDKNDKGGVQIQLIGDEALYGKDYILEPNYKETADVNEMPNPGYVKQSTQQTTDANGNTTIINNYTTYETASWPVVRYMYEPNYIIWISPWSWYSYPDYWSPWEPWYWHRYYGYHTYRYNDYYGNYRSCSNYRSPVVRTHYYNNRKESNMYHVILTSGGFRKTYTRPNQNAEGKMEYFQDRAISPNKGRALEEGKPKINVENPKTNIRKVPPNKSVDKQIQNNNQQEEKPVNKRPSKVNVDDNEKPNKTKPSREPSIDNEKPINTRPSREPSIDNEKPINRKPSREPSNENIKQNNVRPSRESSNENIKIQRDKSSGSERKIENRRIKP
jgi:hypothetical protein